MGTDDSPADHWVARIPLLSVEFGLSFLSEEPSGKNLRQLNSVFRSMISKMSKMGVGMKEVMSSAATISRHVFSMCPVPHCSRTSCHRSRVEKFQLTDNILRLQGLCFIDWLPTDRHVIHS